MTRWIKYTTPYAYFVEDSTGSIASLTDNKTNGKRNIIQGAIFQVVIGYIHIGKAPFTNLVQQGLGLEYIITPIILSEM